MNKPLTLTAAAVLTLAFGVASAAKIPMSVSGKIAKPIVTGATGKVLYEQSGNDLGFGWTSQNFEAIFDQYDIAAADDFTVPVGKTWKVAQVNVVGYYEGGSAGPAVSEHVTFYKDNGGVPGDVVADFPGLMGDDTGGSFSIKLPRTVKLPSGTYWLSVQIDMDLSTSGTWNWENQTIVAGSGPVMRNPLGGSFVGCMQWTNESSCFSNFFLGDHMFTLIRK
jgi:hypothetical protein